jgi:hypothetical protein
MPIKFSPRAILLLVGVILTILGLCAPATFAADNDSPSIFAEADNYCGGSGGMSMSGGSCGIPSGSMSGGCGIPGPSFGGGGASLVPKAPAFEGDSVVPVPEPMNTSSPVMAQLRATIGKPSLDDPTIMKDTGAAPADVSNQGYGFVPVTVLQPVTTYRPVTTWQPTYIPDPAPTAGYRYVERRLGLLGLRGTVVDYKQYGQPAIHSAETEPETVPETASK